MEKKSDFGRLSLKKCKKMRFYYAFDLIKWHFGVTLTKRNAVVQGEL